MTEKIRHDPASLVHAAEQFFSHSRPRQVPAVLRRSGRWVLLDGESFLALFYVTNASWQRFESYRSRQWHPFPGLFAPPNAPALISVEGREAYFDSNATSNGYAFRVGRSSSFILHNHKHSLPDLEGGRAEYVVEVGFVLGVDVIAEFETAEAAFRDLFKHFLAVLRTKP